MKNGSVAGHIGRAAAVLALVCSVALSAWAKLSTAGWQVLILGPLYASVGIVHIFANILALSESSASIQRRSVASSILFFGAFLLQCDQGDGNTWLTLFALVWAAPGDADAKPPPWLPWVATNVLVFLPWALVLVAMWRARTRLRSTTLGVILKRRW
jgi:hypothetical protein